MKNTALLLIDIQKGFHHPTHWGIRNNPEAEKFMAQILLEFRENKLPVIHIQHVSSEPQSPLRPGQEGVEFMDETKPLPDETFFQKNVNSSFIGTSLEEHLRKIGIDQLVIAGLSTDHCVSTTTRMAGNLGFKVLLLSDATATFNRKLEGQDFSAELVHQITLASLDGEFAKVMKTSEVIRWLK